MIVLQSTSGFSSFILFTLIIIQGIVYAQSIPFGRISVEEGLSNSSVNCVLQDHLGFLWIGTDDGLNRYDGYNLKVYHNDAEDSTTLQGNIIWYLFEDHSDYLWIGTKNGKLIRYDPITDKFIYWVLGAKRLNENSITTIYEDKKSFIWIGTYKDGLYKFDYSKNKFEHWQNNADDENSLSNNFVTSILEDEAGNLWIATYNGLNKFKPGTPGKPFSHIYSSTVDTKSLGSSLIWYLGKSTFYTNEMWVGTLNGLFKFNPFTETFSQIKLPGNEGLQFGSSVSSVSEEIFGEDRILWVGTFGGISRINLSESSSIRFIHNERITGGILNNQVHDVIKDRSGVIWIATENGLNFFSPKSVKFNIFFTQRSSFKNIQNFYNKNIRAVAQATDGSLWFGSDAGLFGIKDIASDYSTINNLKLESLNVWSLSPGNNNDLWIGTYGQGLEYFNIETNQLQYYEVKNPLINTPAYSYIKTLLKDKNGMIWIGFWGGGLARLNPSNNKIRYWRNEENNPASLSYNDVWIIYQDSKGRIWIGTNGGGLNLFDDSTENIFYHWSADTYAKEKLCSNSIYSICESHNKKTYNDDVTILWIGTGNGLNKFVISNDKDLTKRSELNIKITNYSVNDGLPDNSIESVLEDEKNNLWIGTNSGISFYDTEKDRFTNYNVSDGLIGNSFNNSSAFKTKNGLMFFGSTAGINVFPPQQIQQSAFSPAVLITDFQVLNQPVTVGKDSPLKTNIIYAEEITLSYNQNVFSFQFASFDYNAPGMNKYAYMMEGFDKEWINSGSRRFATYTNLDPGKYIFHVKATNSDGIWNEKDTKVAVIITPPFWATWWFRALLFLIVAWILYSLYKIRLKRILELERLRIKIASDLHDDIGSALTRISLESELLESHNNTEERKSAAERIGAMSREIITSMSDVVWSIDSRNDSIEDLINRMKDFAFQIFSPKNAQVAFDIFNLDQKKKLKVDIRQNIYLIFKEAINNSAKYSDSDMIKVIMKNDNGKFNMVIHDPETIFTGQKLTGHGLRNMQMRAERIGGKIEFVKDDGFKIILTTNEL